jgi:hypothetical protein
MARRARSAAIALEVATQYLCRCPSQSPVALSEITGNGSVKRTLVAKFTSCPLFRKRGTWNR